MDQEQIDIRKMNEELQKLKKQVSELILLKEDLEFARSVDESWKEYENGEVITINKEDLSKELKKWWKSLLLKDFLKKFLIY